MKLEQLEGINISVEYKMELYDMILALKVLGTATQKISEMTGLSPTEVMKTVFDKRKEKRKQ